MSDKLYSICIPVFNMADTIEAAVESLIAQIDDRYEIILVDDGSTDGSQKVLQNVLRRYPDLVKIRLLKRKHGRLLGETRNISIRESRGKYILLHIDADDVWEPYIGKILDVYHFLERSYGKPILMVGNQINIIERSLALENGPYRNVGRCEDRDMWQMQMGLGNLVWVTHRPIRTRLSRPVKAKYRKAFKVVWGHTMFDCRCESNPFKFLKDCLIYSLRGKRIDETMAVRIWRLLIALPVLFSSYFFGRLTYPDNKAEGLFRYQTVHSAKLTLRNHLDRLGIKGSPIEEDEDIQRIFQL